MNNQRQVIYSLLSDIDNCLKGEFTQYELKKRILDYFNTYPELLLETDTEGVVLIKKTPREKLGKKRIRICLSVLKENERQICQEELSTILENC